MMESENLLDTQWRKFGKWFAFSILGIFIFYLSFYFYIKYIYRGKFALPISLLIIGIALTGHTIFLLHQSTFNFRKMYRFILFIFFPLKAEPTAGWLFMQIKIPTGNTLKADSETTRYGSVPSELLLK